MKLIEGKPEVRKLLPHPLDGALYERMWATLEQAEFPVVFHVADPDIFWDTAQCPDWARQNGWDYSDGSYPSKEDLYAEVDHILARHPNLKISFAHFYFLAHDLECAARFLDLHPCVCFDLAPHMDMYRDFSCAPEQARAFFIRYQDRIIYGTDIDTRALARGAQDFGSALISRMLWSLEGKIKIMSRPSSTSISITSVGGPKPDVFPTPPSPTSRRNQK